MTRRRASGAGSPSRRLRLVPGARGTQPRAPSPGVGADEVATALARARSRAGLAAEQRDERAGSKAAEETAERADGSAASPKSGAATTARVLNADAATLAATSDREKAPVSGPAARPRRARPRPRRAMCERDAPTSSANARRTPAMANEVASLRLLRGARGRAPLLEWSPRGEAAHPLAVGLGLAAARTIRRCARPPPSGEQPRRAAVGGDLPHGDEQRVGHGNAVLAAFAHGVALGIAVHEHGLS